MGNKQPQGNTYTVWATVNGVPAELAGTLETLLRDTLHKFYNDYGGNYRVGEFPTPALQLATAENDTTDRIEVIARTPARSGRNN